MLITEQDATIRQERLYFFQFPEPFPVFQSRHTQQNADAKGKGKAEPATGEDPPKKVTFAEDTKPPAVDAPGADKDKEEESSTVDGVIGQLEIYESGTVKMRMRNGIVMDVSVTPNKLLARLFTECSITLSMYRLPVLHNRRSYNTLST